MCKRKSGGAGTVCGAAYVPCGGGASPVVRAMHCDDEVGSGSAAIAMGMCVILAVSGSGLSF